MAPLFYAPELGNYFLRTFLNFQFSLVQSLSHVQFFKTPWTACSMPGFPVHHQFPKLAKTPLSRWCHPTISSSVISFSSCLQSFPAYGSFPMCPFFAIDRQSIGVSASISVLPMNIQDWFPLGLTGWISLQSKGLLRGLYNITVQQHQLLRLILSFFICYYFLPIWRLSFHIACSFLCCAKAFKFH